MSQKTKKILLIIGFIVLVLIFGFAIYYLFFLPLFAPPVAPPVTPPPAKPTALPTIPPALNINAPIQPGAIIAPGLPPTVGVPAIPTVPGPALSFTATGGLTSFNTIEPDTTLDPTMAANGKDLVYYDTQNGFIYNLTPDGQKKLLSDLPFKNVEKMTWSPNRQKAIMEYPDGSNTIYDFVQKKNITLPAQWQDFQFSPDNQQIAFKDMRLDPENRYLSISDTNGGNFKQIEPLNNKAADVTITWSPNNEYVGFYREAIDGSRSEVYPIGFNGENFKSFRVEGRDPRYVFAPDGNKLVYSVYSSYSNYNPRLWVINSKPDLLGTGRTDLSIDTWADKCTFASNDVLYCAVPKTLKLGAGFRPDMADTTPDDFYKINVLTNSKELLAQPLFPTTAEKLILSADGKSLYWLEKGTGQIKQMNLP